MLHSPLIILGLVGVSKTFHVYIFATICHFSRWAIPDNKGTPLLRRILLKNKQKNKTVMRLAMHPQDKLVFEDLPPKTKIVILNGTSKVALL